MCTDFAAYGCLDLIDKELSAIKTRVTKKQYEKAWIAIEALTLFMEQEDSFMGRRRRQSYQICLKAAKTVSYSGADDGERVIATERAYAVLLVTVFKNHPNLDLEHIPNLRHFLRVAVKFGDYLNEYGDPISNYPALLRRYAREKLGPTDKKLEAALVEEWKAILGEEGRDDIQDDEDDEDPDEDEDPDAWMKERKGDKKIKENDREFALASAWKKYKDCLGGSPSVPFRGPPEWDLTRWTKSERRPFESRR